MRSVCRQHSYIRVPGMTRSSMKWQVRNQSSGWMSASARIEPSPYRPPVGSRLVTRCTRVIRPPGSRSGSARPRPSKAGPNAAARSPRRRASTWRSSYDSTRHRHELLPVVGPDARPSAGGRARSWTIPWPAASASAVKKPGAAVAHRQQRLAVDRRLEPEPEQVRLALAEEVVDVDVVADDLAGAGQPAVEGHDGVEQPVDGQPPGLEVDAEVARQEQVGLARLDGDAGRDPPAVEIPGPGQDVVLGDDPAARTASAARPRWRGCGRPASAARPAGGRGSGGRRWPRTRGRAPPRSSRRRTPGTRRDPGHAAGRAGQGGVRRRLPIRAERRLCAAIRASIRAIWKARWFDIVRPGCRRPRRNASCASARAVAGGHELAAHEVGRGSEHGHGGGIGHAWVYLSVVAAVQPIAEVARSGRPAGANVEAMRGAREEAPQVSTGSEVGSAGPCLRPAGRAGAGSGGTRKAWPPTPTRSSRAGGSADSVRWATTVVSRP